MWGLGFKMALGFKGLYGLGISSFRLRGLVGKGLRFVRVSGSVLRSLQDFG